MGEVNSPLLESKRNGISMASGLGYPTGFNRSRIADELCVIRSCFRRHQSCRWSCQMNTGRYLVDALGSWVSTLGMENQNLPGFVVIYDTSAMINNSTQRNGFMPATIRGFFGKRT